jgi:hypothetical protein
MADNTLDLDSLHLDKGGHSPDGEYCVMEAEAAYHGLPWSDHPPGASGVINDFLIAWNDAMNDADRQQLKRFIGRIVGTDRGPEVELRRSWMALDWYCRVSAPRWLRAAGLEEAAVAVESTASIVDTASAEAALGALREAGQQARAAGDAARAAAGDAARAAAGAAAWDAARAAARAAAWDAARAAARAAAGDAARAAARAAAGDAARDAARAAAGDAARAAAGAAAWDAARAAAWDAARDALRPMVVDLQKSALDLVERMIVCGQDPA